MAEFGETSARYQTYIAGTNDRDMHESLPWQI
jgi:hypothetical protein